MSFKLLKNLFSRKPQPESVQKNHAMLEPLENRQLLSAAATVVSTVADNRGYVEIRFSKTLSAKTITTSSVRVFTPGADGLFNTSDDVLVKETLSYSNSKKTLTINAPVKFDTPYRVKLYSSKLKDSEGLKLDGELKAGGTSGNGVQGGNFEFRARRDTSATPIVRFFGNVGNVDVRLFRGASAFSTVATPLNVANFLKYVNGGDWDKVFINRLVNGFIAQLGGYKLTSKGLFTDVAKHSNPGDVPAELGNSNTLGTLAFALPSQAGAQQLYGIDSKDAATNQFFFNLANNDGSNGNNLNDLSSGGGPFTVFGKVTSSKGLGILAAISGLHRLDQSAQLQRGDLNNIPVRSTVPVSGENPISGGSTTKVLKTSQDLVVFSRVSVLTKVVAVS